MNIPRLIEPQDFLALTQAQAQALAEPQKDKLLLLHVGSAEVYERAHIPGAVLITPAELVDGGAPAPGKLPAKARLEKLFSTLGLTADTHVVAYDEEGGGWAGRLIWTLDMLGHEAWSYLNGGLHAWVGDGMAIEVDQNTALAAQYTVQLNTRARADKAYILAHLDEDDFLVWDARSLEEHEGTKVVAARGGRIPGAAWLEWTDLMDKERGLRLLAPDKLRAALLARGISPDKSIVTHCQSHHRSGLTYLVARLLEYPRIKAYDGSWSEWGNSEETPVESGPLAS